MECSLNIIQNIGYGTNVKKKLSNLKLASRNSAIFSKKKAKVATIMIYIIITIVFNLLNPKQLPILP